MARSQRLRLREVRAVFRLVGECRERGYDCRHWEQHLLAGLQGLIGVPAAMMGDLVAAPPPNPFESSDHAETSGMSVRDRRLFQEMLRRRSFLHDELSHQLFQFALAGDIWARCLLQNDRDWYRACVYDEFLAEARLDDALVSARAVPGRGQPTWVVLCRARGEPRFGDHARALLRLFHQELGPLVGTALAPVQSPPPTALPPRLRQVLTCLLQGDGEKRIAARLGVRPPTVHGYVTTLYRRFGVSGRAELTARFLGRAYPHFFGQGALHSTDPA